MHILMRNSSSECSRKEGNPEDDDKKSIKGIWRYLKVRKYGRVDGSGN